MMSRPTIQWSKEILVDKQDAICRNTARAEVLMAAEQW